MPQPAPPRRAMHMVFLGQSCAASAPPLAALLAAGYPFAAVVLAGQAGPFPTEIERLATEQDIRLVRVASASEATAVISAEAPDVAVAACFPWRLGKVARSTPRLGTFNVHPSLLPAGRGAKPVFWTLRRGESRTGATVHRMDEGFDTGPIVAQAEMGVPEGIRAPELKRQLMALGGQLLVAALPALAAGTLPLWPQPAQGITLAPPPSPADWTMVSTLPAGWAWRFARGVAPLGGPLTVITGGAIIPVVDALDWSPQERLADRVMDEGDGTVRVRFSPGWVRFQRPPD